MNEVDIRKYAELMQELGLTGLEITEDKQKVRLERSVPVVTEYVSAPVPSTTAPAANTKPATSADSSDCVSVPSPIVGVFYAAPAENAEPYVKVGDSVSKGQVLCIVEAMKLMNEIVCEYDGTIAEVCVTNGQPVEYGTVLFKIKR